MTYYTSSNDSARLAMEMLRSQMVSQLFAASLSASANTASLSLTEFVLGQGKSKPGRSGTDIMNDALSGLRRSDAALYRQASKNMTEGVNLVDAAAEGVKSVREKLARMQEIVSELQSDPTKQSVLEIEYEDLASAISAIVKGTEYNGIKLLDGSSWSGEERVAASQDGLTGKVSLQAGKASTEVTLFNLESLKNLYVAGDLDTPADLAAAAQTLSTIDARLSGIQESYESRSKLLASESAYFDKQAGIMDVADSRSVTGDEQSLREALLELLLRDQGNIVDSKG